MIMLHCLQSHIITLMPSFYQLTACGGNGSPEWLNSARTHTKVFYILAPNLNRSLMKYISRRQKTDISETIKQEQITLHLQFPNPSSFFGPRAQT